MNKNYLNNLNKNYIIIFLIFLVVSLIGYQIFSNEKYYLILEVEKLNREKEADLFDKKAECEKYFKVVKEEYEKVSDGVKLTPFPAIFSKTFLFTFYSPKENSCLYVVEQEFAGEHKEFFIYNALTKSTITSFQYSDQFDEYKDFILEYSNGEVRL